MNRTIVLLFCLTAWACQKKTTSESPKAVQPPRVEEQGRKIIFPEDQKSLAFFETEVVKKENLSAQYAAPASVAVAIVQSSERGGRNTVLFDNADLSATYSQFLQHIINIHTLQVNLNRVKDLEQHGAATGKEVLDAETQLANEEAAITEQEAKLKLAGLDPAKLKEPRNKEAWLICEVPENQIAQVKPGTKCTVTFTAFGDKQYNASVNGIGAEVDNITRMVKVRVVLPNADNRFEVGMFANVIFDLKNDNTLSVPVSALVNVQGKDYMFVATTPNTFERKEVLIGQQLDSKVVVLHGLNENDKVVIKGAMELKGLSFGY
ncbi:efflux RND transporter periplasmic adaptor subunit [Ohtaekwangia sp.]|uniref:efflux RND transporter periplasmic adaptor subunit n=1 Tax=Ohtaekwangia sp. TaxID=2066019 RepID=UPI002F94A209